MNPLESLAGALGAAFAVIAAMFLVVYVIQHVSSRKRRH